MAAAVKGPYRESSPDAPSSIGGLYRRGDLWYNGETRGRGAPGKEEVPDMIRLIACDIDGTLLHNGAAAIDNVIFKEILRLREKGILFCPASGRQYGSLRRLFGPVANELAYLCENGAVLVGAGDPGPTLGKTVMDRETALALCREIMETPRCEVLISGANTSYLCPKEPDIVDHIRYFVGNNLSLLAGPKDMPEEIVKVSAYCRDGAQSLEPLMAPRWQARFRVAVSGENWLDFTLADKGLGIRALCRSLGVELEEVMAFGDNYNDLPMLEAVGFPYIMDNAAAELRRRFPHHCRRVEEVLKTL